MNCTELDGAMAEALDQIVESDAGFAVCVLTLACVSISLLTHGEELVRPLAAIVGGLVGGGGGFLLTRFFQPSLPCEARLGVAGVAAVVVATLAICVLKTGLFLLGAFGLGSIAHLVWESLPLKDVEGPFILFARPGWYYIAVGAAGVAGAVASQLQKKHFTRIASSVLGGSGLAVGTHLVFSRSGQTAPPVLLLCVVVLSSAFGTYAQHRLGRWRRDRRDGQRRRRTHRAFSRRDYDDRDMVAMGRPVA